MADQPSRRLELAAIAASLRGHLAWQEAESGRSILRPIGAKPAALPEVPPRPRMKPPPRAEAKPAKSEVIPPPARAEARPAGAPGVAASPPKVEASDGAPYQPKAVTLDELRQEHLDCQRCKLCRGRCNLVFGTGSPLAEVVFVGEAPGEEEDKQGVPFVGKAGQLLTKMIEAMGYRRDEVYICNVVKCRPPDNRNPEADEIAACEPFLKAQLRMIHPKVIVALGKFAAQTLLRDSTAISRMRGRWREYEGIPLMPTFHPAYLLRSPGEKKPAWGDLQKVMALLGKKPPAK